VIFDLLFELILQVIFEAVWWLVTTYPAIGVPLLLGVVVGLFALYSKRRWAAASGVLGFIGVTVIFQRSVPVGLGATAALLIAGFLYDRLTPEVGWTARGSSKAPSTDSHAIPRPSGESPRARLDRLRLTDPEFSTVLFEDFAYLLFTEVHRARGDRALERVAPYVTEETRTWLASRPVRAVRDVVIGAMRVVSVELVGAGQPHTSVLLEFEANYTEVSADDREQGLYTVEQWRLTRAGGATSKRPEKTSILECPACGAPLEVAVGGACKYCHKVVEDDSFAWRVARVTLVRREDRAPVLTADVAEQGTDLPTITDPDAWQRFNGIEKRDPSFSMEALRSRVDRIFAALQIGWSTRDISQARPLVSDNLNQSLGYWIDAYRKAGLTNLSEQAAVSGVELARVSSDRHFDAITLRVRASGLDYVVDDGGKLVSGSRDSKRDYTEYWTLIRSATRSGPAGDPAACPGCGAPLDINMAGHCKHCQAKVTSGEFDWVLSRIEQDESYQG
jgi:hypothetical protein